MYQNFLLVDKSILPDYYEKVIEARALLSSGKIKDVSEAVKQVGIPEAPITNIKTISMNQVRIRNAESLSFPSRFPTARVFWEKFCRFSPNTVPISSPSRKILPFTNVRMSWFLSISRTCF